MRLQPEYVVTLTSRGSSLPTVSSSRDEIVANLAPILVQSDGGGGGASFWGAIGGDISLQADLQAALDDKADTASLGSAAATDAGDYATAAQGVKANIAHAWGDHSAAGYLTSVAWADITGKPVFFDGAYSSLSGIPTEFTPAAHSHTVADVLGLQAALNDKSNTGHGHAIADITGLQDELDTLEGTVGPQGPAGADGVNVTITVAADQAAFDAATPSATELVVLYNA